jgi:hypothetical protein
MSPIVEVIAQVSAAIDLLKKARDVAQKTRDAELQNTIADLMMLLADIKIEVAHLKEENHDLKQNLAAAQRGPVRPTVRFDNGVYYLAEPLPDGRPDGPYCPRCLDSAGKLMLLTERSDAFRFFGRWHCHECDSDFGKD